MTSERNAVAQSAFIACVPEAESFILIENATGFGNTIQTFTMGALSVQKFAEDG